MFEGVLRDAKADRFQVLVVWAIDRFGRSMSRNLNDVLDLDAAGVRVVSCREQWLDMRGPVRDLLVAIFSWAAQQERDRIRERIGAGLRRVREKDGVTSRPGFGLRNVRNKEKDVSVRELDPAKLPTVRRVAELAVALGSSPWSSAPPERGGSAAPEPRRSLGTHRGEAPAPEP